MTNFDAYKDKLKEAFFAVVNGKPTNCDDFACVNCLFEEHRSCTEARWEWLKKEYKE